ncbi:hypothetical protein VB734_11135 [Synechococcus sp. BA-124 BA4]|uniref:hypothetical protein n=1 Tax=unclassified Synechococcus TaxID=2626047 RepID=UPI0018CCC05D|nr:MULTISPECIES: hypothetical protein [unclassified Synechococcus]MEA5400589.1 hypothetical protein [Synechococcus sp. BA-124 BA4]QPN55946.1 hypothetical protein I1E95_12485 [Synechococcus sp. CBW1107]CAK6700260.1 hypothetical protein BBFGKLBO_02825 [Synechococcus sp. CBW1107]
MGLSVVVVMKDRRKLQRLRDRLTELQPAPRVLTILGEGESSIDSVELLNPALARQRRQRSMVRWLMPFGFFAGLMFTFITDLHTFAFAGTYGEPVIGGLLGMGSGWMGSYAAAASVRSEADDRIRSLRNRLEEGSWLLLVESSPGQEIPWLVIQQAGPQAVVRLGEG